MFEKTKINEKEAGMDHFYKIQASVSIIYLQRDGPQFVHPLAVKRSSFAAKKGYEAKNAFSTLEQKRKWPPPAPLLKVE